jgi:hypothetical protein
VARSFAFVIASIFAIGYGNPVPTTVGGRIFIMLFFPIGFTITVYTANLLCRVMVAKFDHRILAWSKWIASSLSKAGVMRWKTDEQFKRSIRAREAQAKRKYREWLHAKIFRKQAIRKLLKHEEEGGDKEEQKVAGNTTNHVPVVVTPFPSKFDNETSRDSHTSLPPSLVVQLQENNENEIARRKLTTKFFQLAIVICWVLVWIVISAAIFSKFENSWSYWDAIWFAFVTLTTIGYGDYYCTTASCAAYLPWFIWLGIGSFAYIFTLVVEIFNEVMKSDKSRHQEFLKGLHKEETKKRVKLWKDNYSLVYHKLSSLEKDATELQKEYLETVLTYQQLSGKHTHTHRSLKNMGASSMDELSQDASACGALTTDAVTQQETGKGDSHLYEDEEKEESLSRSLQDELETSNQHAKIPTNNPRMEAESTSTVSPCDNDDDDANPNFSGRSLRVSEHLNITMDSHSRKLNYITEQLRELTLIMESFDNLRKANTHMIETEEPDEDSGDNDYDWSKVDQTIGESRKFR